MRNSIISTNLDSKALDKNLFYCQEVFNLRSLIVARTIRTSVVIDVNPSHYEY